MVGGTRMGVLGVHGGGGEEKVRLRFVDNVDNLVDNSRWEDFYLSIPKIL